MSIIYGWDKMVKEGEKVIRDGKTYYVLARRFGHIKNYYLFRPDELKKADSRFRKYFEYK